MDTIDSTRLRTRRDILHCLSCSERRRRTRRASRARRFALRAVRPHPMIRFHVAPWPNPMEGVLEIRSAEGTTLVFNDLVFVPPPLWRFIMAVSPLQKRATGSLACQTHDYGGRIASSGMAASTVLRRATHLCRPGSRRSDLGQRARGTPRHRREHLTSRPGRCSSSQMRCGGEAERAGTAWSTSASRRTSRSVARTSNARCTKWRSAASISTHRSLMCRAAATFLAAARDDACRQG
jgi:hypothetical protein